MYARRGHNELAAEAKEKGHTTVTAATAGETTAAVHDFDLQCKRESKA